VTLMGNFVVVLQHVSWQGLLALRPHSAALWYTLHTSVPKIVALVCGALRSLIFLGDPSAPATLNESDWRALVTI